MSQEQHRLHCYTYVCTYVCMYMYVYKLVYMTYCEMYVCVYMCVGTKTSNIDHMPTIWVQVCMNSDQDKNVLAWSMYRYVNICCDVYYHVSGNENVEQWPYAQRLTLASVAHGQSRVPWQKNCVIELLVYVHEYCQTYVSVNANYAAECHRNAINLGLCMYLLVSLQVHSQMAVDCCIGPTMRGSVPM